MPDGERGRQFSNSQVREMDPLHCYVLEFFRLRKFSSRSMVTVTPLAERLSHHEGREGHDHRAEKEESNLKKIFPFVLFVCFVVLSISALIAVLPR